MADQPQTDEDQNLFAYIGQRIFGVNLNPNEEPIRPPPLERDPFVPPQDPAQRRRLMNLRTVETLRRSLMYVRTDEDDPSRWLVVNGERLSANDLLQWWYYTTLEIGVVRDRPEALYWTGWTFIESYNSLDDTFEVRFFTNVLNDGAQARISLARFIHWADIRETAWALSPHYPGNGVLPTNPGVATQ